MQAAKAKLAENKDRFEGLLQQEKSIHDRLLQEEHDAEKVMEVFLAVQKDVETMLALSLINAQNLLFQAGGDDNDDNSGLANAPSFGSIKQLVEALFTVMESSGKIERYRASASGREA